MWLITIGVILITFYLILIRIFRVGWESIDDFQPKDNLTENIKVSVVVSCKNEEKALPCLIKSLTAQSMQNFELILVNDHSTDRTPEIMSEAVALFQNAICIHAKENGKKRAIAEGIQCASGDLIITTDADCKPERRWIETIVKFQIENPSHLIICPVKLTEKRTFFSRLQQIEFTSLVASGAGAAGAQFPIMCNAANMAFTKTAWLKSQSDMKPEEQSGDDVFLLQSIKKRGGVIRFLRSKKAFVETESAESLSAFIRQRRRWAGKSTSYTDWHLILVACLVFAVCVMQLAFLILSFFNSFYCYFFLLFFVIKYWADTMFLSKAGDFFALKQVPFYSFFLSVVYPFYIVFTAVSSLFLKPKKW